jgi:hypothetical protein
LPSQVPATVAEPFAHVGAAHVTLAPTKPRQVPGFVPSHCAAEHGADAVPGEHAARPPCGAPTMGTHVPADPVPSHASHSPAHAALQHTPSTQKSPSGHSAVDAHDTPSAVRGWQVPASHQAVATQSLDVVHVAGQEPEAPEHR